MSACRLISSFAAGFSLSLLTFMVNAHLFLGTFTSDNLKSSQGQFNSVVLSMQLTLRLST